MSESINKGEKIVLENSEMWDDKKSDVELTDSKPTIEEQLFENQRVLGETNRFLDEVTQSTKLNRLQLDSTRRKLGLQPLDLLPPSMSHDKEMVMRLEAKRDEMVSREKMLKAQNLIEQIGGFIDAQVKPYKKFDTAKHERFFIQKGQMNGRDAVFKIGEARDGQTIRDESRNLKIIERAPLKQDATMDVRFVRQVGDVYSNEEMIGLATEYVQDNPEFKQRLSGKQKVEVIGRVIDHLQKLVVTDAVREKGLPIHDGKKIASDSRFFLSELARGGYLDPTIAETLQRKFQEAETSLTEEEPVFVHGDAHGDNIFINNSSDGNTDITLLDFEGLRISNRYHDWSEILNKSFFLQYLQNKRPELFEPIKKNVENMWLDTSVLFDENTIIEHISQGDPEKKRNFQLTRVYDLLCRVMNDLDASNPMKQERTHLYLEQIKNNAI